LNPAGFHLTNLLLHIANTLLLFGLLTAMTGSPRRSGFVAALFALHPLHVESVAWVTERKDVLSTFFWMLTLWAYWGYTRRPGVRRYLLVAGCFGAALLSKPMAVTLPVVGLAVLGIAIQYVPRRAIEGLETGFSRIGWVGRTGRRLRPDAEGILWDPVSGDRYREIENALEELP